MVGRPPKYILIRVRESYWDSNYSTRIILIHTFKVSYRYI
jgi:hypothetical protein